MITIQRSSASGKKIRRVNTSPYNIRTIAEMKQCLESQCYGHLRASTRTTTGVPTPQLANLYTRDTATWTDVFGTGYDSVDWGAAGPTNFIQDAFAHSHGNATYVSESKCMLSWLDRYYMLQDGICIPPTACRMWLQSCGMAKYTVVPQYTAGTIAGGTIGPYATFDWETSGGLSLYFWNDDNQDTAQYLISHSKIAALNAAAGNTISLVGGVWPMWSGGILTDNLPLVAAMFANTSVVKCRFRWYWDNESITPLGCRYCYGSGNTGNDCGQPIVKMKYASYPSLFAWG